MYKTINKRQSSGKYFLALAAMAVIVFNSDFISKKIQMGGEHVAQIAQTQMSGAGRSRTFDVLDATPPQQQSNTKVVFVPRAVAASSTPAATGGWRPVMAAQAQDDADEQAQRLEAENSIKAARNQQLEEQAQKLAARR